MYPPHCPAPPVGDISVDFANANICEVVAQILGTILKASCTIDLEVHGTGTLRTSNRWRGPRFCG